MRSHAVIALVLFAAIAAAAQTPQPEQFTRQEVMVPMRDGVHLQTVIFTPKNTTAPLPILLTRTPYGVPDSERGLVSGVWDDFNRDGYIYVMQNLRGRFKSEGRWVMQRDLCTASTPSRALPARAGGPAAAKCVDESTDAYDTIAWLLKNVPNNNGRVGIWGISYSGWTTAMALVNPHPALKAASEQASPADMFLGDDFHHNGAFRLSYGFEYSAMMETNRENFRFQFDRYDTYEWYLALGALSNANARYFHGNIPTWNDFVAHPNRDEFWYKQSFDSSLRRTSVPNLNVAGWWDQEDFYGPVRIYELLEKNDPDHLNYIVAGPWNHGGWMRPSFEHLGPVEFGSDTSKDFRAKIMAPWFRYWLHNTGKLTQPEAMMFETGTNEWKSYDAWPPKQATPKKLYFHAGRKLSWEAPTAATAAFDSYTSDPANPVPYRPRPVRPTYPGPEWPVWLVQDQRFVDHRPDVLTFETEPLTEDVVIAGDVVADLFAATTGSDADWIVKLIDVYPEDYKPAQPPEPAPPGQPRMQQLTGGYQLIIADEVFRGRFRKSFEKPQPITPHAVEEYKFSLRTSDHAFRKGHRIMVQVQSTWFPVIDRNPQKFVPNIFQATDADYVKATQSIYRTRTQPSGVILPVISQE
jgi:putative CocE/NonD family hydrolase